MDLTSEKEQPTKTSYRLLLTVVVLAVFLPVNFFGGMGLDDYEFIERLESHSAHFNLFGAFFPSESVQYYRPLLEMISILDFRLWGFQYTGYHLTNLLAHLLNAHLVYSIAQKLFRAKRDCARISLTASLLFALHPLVCESTVWISGRSDLFGSMFSLMAFRTYLSDRKIKYVLTPFFVLLGLLCKENALAVIPIIVIANMLLWFQEKNDLRKCMGSTATWAVILVIPLVLYLYLRTGGGAVLSYDYIEMPNTMGESHAVYLKALGYLAFQLMGTTAFYLKKLILPFPLNLAIHSIHVQAYFILCCIFTLINVYWLKRKKYALILWSILLVCSFLPALPVAIGGIAWVPYAERYLYLSVVVLSFVLVFLFYGQSDKSVDVNRVNTYFTICICFMAVMTFSRVIDWRNPESLFKDTLKKNPDNGKILYKYGKALGPYKGNEYFTRAIHVGKDEDWKDFSYLALASHYAKTDNKPMALDYIDHALEIKDSSDNYLQAVTILSQIKFHAPEEERAKTDKMIGYYTKAIKKKFSPFILYQIGILNQQRGDLDAAKESYTELIEKAPMSPYAGYAKKKLNTMGQQRFK